MKAGIAIDAWKLPIFDRHLTQAGYTYKNGGPLAPGTLLLTIETENIEACSIVVRAANTEAAMIGAQPISDKQMEQATGGYVVDRAAKVHHE